MPKSSKTRFSKKKKRVNKCTFQEATQRQFSSTILGTIDCWNTGFALGTNLFKIDEPPSLSNDKKLNKKRKNSIDIGKSARSKLRKRREKLSQLTPRYYKKRIKDITAITNDILHEVIDTFQVDNMILSVTMDKIESKTSLKPIININPPKKLINIPKTLDNKQEDDCQKLLISVVSGTKCDPDALAPLIRYLLILIEKLNKNDVDIGQVVWMLDQNQISLSKYGKLRTLFPIMPSLKKISKYRKELESKVLEDIKIYSGDHGSVWIDPLQLLKHIIKIRGLENLKHLDLFFRGDGRAIGKKIGSVIFTMSVLQEGKSVHSLDSIYTIGIFPCRENYEEFAFFMKPLIEMLKEMYLKIFIDLSGKEKICDHYLGGDQKFLRMIVGQQSCGAQYFCVYCDAKRCDIGDLSTTTFWFIDDTRFQKIGHKGQSLVPLLPWIVPDHVIPDYLHCFLRMSDHILYRSICDFFGLYSNEKSRAIQISKVIKEKSGVTLDFYSRGKESKKNLVAQSLTYGDLDGGEHLRILNSINGIIDALLISNKTSLKEVWLKWKLLNEKYASITPKEKKQHFTVEHSLETRYFKMQNSQKLPEYDETVAQSLRDSSLEFCQLLVKKWDLSVLKNYAHIMVQHFPLFHHLLKLCNCQVLERQNQRDKIHYHNTISKRRLLASKQIMLTKVRILFNHNRPTPEKYFCCFCDGEAFSYNGNLRRHYSKKHGICFDDQTDVLSNENSDNLDQNIQQNLVDIEDLH